MIGEFLIKYWSDIMLAFFVANAIFKRFPWKPGKDLLDLLWDIVKFVTAPSKGPGKLPMLFIGFFLIGLLLSGQAFAEPFLKAGATLNATKWQIELDGVVIDVPVFATDAGTVWMRYDLANVSNGDHLVKVRAGNQWGWSEWYPLAFTKALAGVTVPPFIE